MGETIRIVKGLDWCNIQVAKKCLGKLSITSKCWFLGDLIRICGLCLQELNKEEFPEGYEWALEIEERHEGPCEMETVDFRSEEVTFCPRCLRKVLLEHNPRALDWVLSFHDNARHTEPTKSGLYGSEVYHQACRECLLLVLYRVDPNFFDLVTTARGKALLSRLIVCKCGCHEGGDWEGPWHCSMCGENHQGWILQILASKRKGS